MFHNFTTVPEASPYDEGETSYELMAEEERKKYVCKYKGCGKFFRYKSEIIRHTATHSESRPFICHYDNCFKAFKRNDALENHVRSSHTKETPFICPFPDCGMKFTTHGSFRYHVLKHNKQGLEIESPVNIKEPLPEVYQQRKQVKLNSPTSSVPFTEQKQSMKVEPVYQKLKMHEGNEEFIAPPPRFASSLKWSFVQDDNESEVSEPKAEEPQQNQLNTILEENKCLKQKLSTSEKVIKNMQKQIDDLLGNLFAYQQSNNLLSRAASVSPSTQEQSYPASNFDDGEKLGEPMMDMINYGEEKNLLSPSEMYTAPIDTNVLDNFFSFGKEMNFIDF